MDVSTLMLTFLFNLILTAFVYMLVPVIIVVSKKKYTEETIKLITVINGVACFAFFLCLYIVTWNERMPNIVAAFVWSSINYTLLKKTSCVDDFNNQLHFCMKCGSQINAGYLCRKCYESINNTSSSSITGNITSQQPQLSSSSYIYSKPTNQTNNMVYKTCLCPQCGVELIEGSKFCRKCGMNITVWENQMESKYTEAVRYMNSLELDDIEKAEKIFKELNGYKDSIIKVNECLEKYFSILNEKTYQEALACIKEKRFDLAIELLRDVPNWKNSNELINKCLEDKRKEKKKYNLIVFVVSFGVIFAVLIAVCLRFLLPY